MARVYIETTIPSFYFETRTEDDMVAWRNATRVWWDRHRLGYSLCTSEFTLEELAAAPGPKAAQCLELLRGVEVLEPPAGLEELIEYYTTHRLVPQGPDAAHLALTSLHGVEFLLTWNCRHLANANKARHLAVLNARMGLAAPVLTTPLTLVPETDP